jgi:hypothetical protein
MNLAPHLVRVIESMDRRILGAFRLIDAVTGLPVVLPFQARALGAALLRPGGNIEVPLSENSVQIRQNRSGIHVLFCAPFFDEYTSTFLNPRPPTFRDPQPPHDALPVQLLLRLGFEDPGPHYLPQEFLFDLPRSTNPADANSVFDPLPVILFRSPTAPVQDGWTVLRVSVTQAETDPPHPLPGVLIRVFRAPRADNPEPIGQGMTDWRGEVRGEALLPITGVRRFRPGAGANVIEAQQTLEFIAVRDPAFTGGEGLLPDGPKLLASIDAQLVHAPNPAAVPPVPPPRAPLSVRAAHEFAVHLIMP